MPFDFDNLRIFLAAVDHGSFSAAARFLRRVPSSVSMAIGNLEAELDLQLFDRTGREPKLTMHGQALLPQARLLMDQLKKLNVHAGSLAQKLETSLTVVFVPELFGTVGWSGALYELSEQYPLLDVEVLTAPQADALAMVASGRADVALVFERYGIDSETNFEEIARENLVAVVSSAHPILGKCESDLVRDDELMAERQIVLTGRHHPSVDKRLSISRRQWKTDSPVIALEMVVAGAGWAWLPSSFTQPSLAEGRIVKIPIQNFSNSLDLYVDVVWSKQKPLGLAAGRFVHLLKADETRTIRFSRPSVA